MPTQRKIVGIIDDDPSMLTAAENLLDAHGFATKSFASAEEFLASGSTPKIHCLLLDIHLGGMSGVDLFHYLEAKGSGLPVVFMTALDNEAVRQQALAAGGVACLRKPFAARDLIGAIGRALQ
jgi:FixJ family two-component response regulator